jgi:hypothetical protein
MAIANDLPGEDDQKSVEDIHRKNGEWLNLAGPA